ncbi:NAD-dependent epimerase/dehydratase family protein [Magnetovibrio sp. PR-2]|uniref:NAD-dependent epimerase/dehydratase family protein n=1 Tax=Magnetovibrio sp. PR-2 TaxID=3120356 RepID=UPI002FCE6233
MLEHLNAHPQNPERVVILGAKGFVGSATADVLAKDGVEVLALGRQELDLLGGEAARDLANVLKPSDSVVVISAQAPVKNNAMLESNIAMMSNVCAAFDQVEPAHMVYVSSDAVYADSMEPLDERSCAEPGSLHGIMHIARETMLANAYSGPLGILRPTLIYGESDPHNGYGPNRFRRLAAEGEDIVLFGEGEEQRDHVLIDDVADLIVRMLKSKSHGKLNAATGTVISFRHIALAVVAQFSDPVDIKGSPRVGEMPHNGYRAFNPAATKAAFPDFSYTDIQTGLSQVHAQMMEKL